MRLFGHNILAILLAAVVIYGVDYVIFVLMIPEHYQAIVGLNEEQMHVDRQPLGVVMPVLTAIGLSLVISWRDATWLRGIAIGILMAVFVAFPSALYAYVYGSHTGEFVLLNLGRLAISFAIVGALLGGWKRSRE